MIIDFFTVILNVFTFFVIGYSVIKYVLSKKNETTKKGFYFILFFTIEHFLITAVFAFFLDKFTTVNDPQRFYLYAKNIDNWFSLFNFGNPSMSFLIFPLVKIGLKIETLFFLFSLIGWKGFLILFKNLKINQLEKITIFHLFFFIPTIHLWTSSLSKEPLLLFFIALILNEVGKEKNMNYLYVIISFLFFLLIRPHVFFVLLFCFGLIVFEVGKIKNITFKMILSLLVISILSIYIVYLVSMNFLMLDSFSLESLKIYYHKFLEEYSNSGSAGISIENTSFLERVLYIIFMPLPFFYKPKSIFQWYVSFENIYYVLTMPYFIYLILKNKIRRGFFIEKDTSYALLCSIILMMLFGSYLYNMGLGNRMRIMFFPSLFYFMIKIYSKGVNIKIREKSK